MKATEPQAIKALGREVKGFKPRLWDDVGLDIVVQGNFAKFTQNEAMRDELLNTGDKVHSPPNNLWQRQSEQKRATSLVLYATCETSLGVSFPCYGHEHRI